MAQAFTEHLTSLIRVGERTSKHGDPFDLAVIVRWTGPHSAELVSMSGHVRFTAARFRAIEKELVRLGIERVHWNRMNGGKPRLIVRKKRDVPRTKSGQGEASQ